MNHALRYLLGGLTLILIGLIIGFQLKGNMRGMSGAPVAEGVGKLEDALFFIEDNYVEQPDHAQLVENAIKGMLDGLDPHSFYIPASEMQVMEEQLEGGFDGIGVQFNIVDDTIYVEMPLPGGPSIELGIQSGDRIIEVDGDPVAGIGISNEDVLKKLKGEKGSEVKLTILRRGYKDLLQFTVIRDRIPIYSIEYSYLIDETTGYIKITRFAENTYQEFREALLDLKEQGMQNLVLDLRGNPGGYMNIANKIADEFLRSGELIVSTIGRTASSKQEYFATSSIGAFEHGPLIILIDYNSASASEIVAGAVQDHDRGLIVGVRSFGKGLVQIPKKFDDNSAMRLVISKYYTPSGRCIQKPYDQGEEAYDAEIQHRFESGEIFDESKVEFPDSLTFKTTSGRKVYGGGGIYPDAFVAYDTTGNSKYFTDLRINDLFRLFSFDYVDKRPDLVNRYPTPEAFVKQFVMTPEVVNAFTRFAAQKGVPFVQADYQASRFYIDNRVKAFIGRHLFNNDDAFYPVLLQTDNQLSEALHLIPVAAELEGSGKLNLALKE
ncbi:MAG: S41 family peptidase [Bacteroidia bacterium]|nr:S41 family peptidase [Bacteroidia bacterium]